MSKKAERFISQSYSKLRDQTGIDRAVWSRYLTGKTKPGLKQLQRIADVAGVPVEDVLKAMRDRMKKTIERKNDG